MEMVVRITALCVVGALLALVLKRGAPEQALLLALAVTVLIFLLLGNSVRQLILFFKELAGKSGISGALFVPLYKTVGIALVVKAGGGLCRDAGESAMAAMIETAGTVCALLVALPLFQTVLAFLMELMQI